MTHKPRIGLALGGGGARGLAHIGVLKVLEREGIAIDLLSGTSMGGLISAGYAVGMSASDLEQEALQMASVRRLLALVDRSLPRRGLFQCQRVMDYLTLHLGDHTFDDLRIPLALVAVDVNTRQEVILRQGRIVDAVRASISIPGLFAPVERGDQLLVDGGVLNNLPVDVVRSMGADVVIAVDVHSDDTPINISKLHQHRYLPNGLMETFNVLWRCLDMMKVEIGQYKLTQVPPDVLIHPSIPADITTLIGFLNAAEIIAAGEKAAQAILPEMLRPRHNTKSDECEGRCS